MYDILKAIAAVEVAGVPQFNFTYARRDFANLYDELEVDKPHIFLDPVQIDYNFSGVNQVESSTQQGTFMILVNSSIDEQSYDYRYQNYIKPLLAGAMETIQAALVCTYPVTISSWRTTEVINMLDYNMDGLIVTFNITIDE